VRNDAVFALPEPFTYAEGAAFTVAARTAYHALVERGRLAGWSGNVGRTDHRS
jgi:NADPH:quinone reductase-like Zn-dependent oxidoreductase